jgi:hypothetical protein
MCLLVLFVTHLYSEDLCLLGCCAWLTGEVTSVLEECNASI